MRGRVALLYSLGVVMVSFIMLCGFTVGFTQHSIHENNKTLCTIIANGAGPRPRPPSNPDIQPTTAYGKALKNYNDQLAAYNAKNQRNLIEVGRHFHCPSLK